MANTVIALRSSGVASNVPDVNTLANGEVALNFADGVFYYKTDIGTLGTINSTQPAGLDTEVQFNDSGVFGSSANLTFNKTTGVLTTNDINVASGITIGNINVASAIEANAVIAQAAFDKANTDTTTVAVEPGTYGNATSLLSVTVAANGRLTNVTTSTFEAATIGDVLAISIALG